jgi:hypothetical protein
LGVEAQTTAASALSSSATNEAAAAGTHESDLKLPTETPMKDEDPETTESLQQLLQHSHQHQRYQNQS